MLKQEKVKIEKEVAERKEIDLLERRKFLCSQKEEMDKLYEEQEQQRIENVMFREQLEKQVDSIMKILTELNKREKH
jgi:hypothetical protein